MEGCGMTSAISLGRIAVALCLAALAAGVPPLRVAVLDWIVAVDLVPGLTSADGIEEAGQAVPTPNAVADA
jgi:hypothetical protein